MRDHLGMPGFRTGQMTLVPTLLDAAIYHGADLAELDHKRWPVETARAHLKTTMQRDVLRCTTVAGVLKALPIFALIDNLGRMVRGQSAIRQHLSVERISCVEAPRGRGAPSTEIP